MKPSKKFQVLGTIIGIGIWALLAYLFYPHWSAYLFGLLLAVNVIVLLKQGVKA